VTYAKSKDIMYPCEQCDFAYNREPYNVVSAKHFIGEVVYEGVRNLLVSAALSDKFPYIQKTILGNVDVNTAQIDATQAIVATKTNVVEAVAAVLADDAYVKNDGDAMTGDLDMGGNDITNIDSASTISLQQAFMIGEDNRKYITCVYEATSEPGKTDTTGLRLSNADGTEAVWIFVLAIPYTLGSLSLQIDGLRVNITDADSDDYVKSIIAAKVDGSTKTNLVTFTNDGAFYKTVEVVSEAFTVENVSDAEKVGIKISLVSTSARQCDIAGVLLRCYYA